MTLVAGNYVECDYGDGSYAEAIVERVNDDGSVYVALDGGCFATFASVDVEFVISGGTGPVIGFQVQWGTPLEVDDAD